MEILTAESQKRVCEPFQFDLSVKLDPVEYAERTVEFSDVLRVWGEYVFDGKAFAVNGRIRTVLHTRCALCDQPTDEPIECTFQERFVKNAERTDDDSYPYAGDRLIIDEMVMDNLFLNLPITTLCKPDCKGLCPVCGANRNLSPCGCSEPAKPNAFAALEQYKV